MRALLCRKWLMSCHLKPNLGLKPPNRGFTGLKAFSITIATDINDLPETSPHGGDFSTIRKFLKLHRFEQSTRHSNGTRLWGEPLR